MCLTELILSIKHMKNEYEGFPLLSMKRFLILDSHSEVNNKKTEQKIKITVIDTGQQAK